MLDALTQLDKYLNGNDLVLTNDAHEERNRLSKVKPYGRAPRYMVNPKPESDPLVDGYRSLPEAMAQLLLKVLDDRWKEEEGEIC